jgi:hypothetical protein
MEYCASVDAVLASELEDGKWGWVRMGDFLGRRVSCEVVCHHFFLSGVGCGGVEQSLVSVAEDVVMESLGFSITCLDEAALLALSALLPSTRRQQWESLNSPPFRESKVESQKPNWPSLN